MLAKIQSRPVIFQIFLDRYWETIGRPLSKGWVVASMRLEGPSEILSAEAGLLILARVVSWHFRTQTLRIQVSAFRAREPQPTFRRLQNRSIVAILFQEHHRSIAVGSINVERTVSAIAPSAKVIGQAPLDASKLTYANLQNLHSAPNDKSAITRHVQLLPTT